MNPKVELHIKDHGVVTLELDEQKALRLVEAMADDNDGHCTGPRPL